MFFIVLILSIFVFCKTMGYAIYEYKNNSNQIAAIVIAVMAVVALIAPCVVTLL
ncbi:MAG: hypothetical protein HFJ51_04360 [Clostridia bacterium]|nr:hypothetical protein [Clostridia bacterium]